MFTSCQSTGHWSAVKVSSLAVCYPGVEKILYQYRAYICHFYSCLDFKTDFSIVGRYVKPANLEFLSDLIIEYLVGVEIKLNIHSLQLQEIQFTVNEG